MAINAVAAAKSEIMNDFRGRDETGACGTDRSRKEVEDLLLEILHAHPEGIGEYDLLVLLRDRGVPVFGEGAFSDTLFLYQAHFLLFHLLYSLDEELVRAGRGGIQIHCMRIVLRQNPRDDLSLPAPPDFLRSYYRDLSALDAMDRQGVDDLIARFWEMYADWDRRLPSLAELGLAEPVSRQEIKDRFRQLAKKHHPDRGGDPVRFARISEAAAVLLG